MKKALIILSSVAMIFSSCLKDENITNRKYGIEGVEDVPLVGFLTNRTTTPLASSNKDTTFRLLAVRLSEENPASEDVKVTLVPNNALVTGAGYTVAPTSAYTLDNLVVTIPKGEREGYLTITTKTSNLAAATYGFGFSIASVSNPKYTINAIRKDILAVLPVKNKYDGTYTSVGYVYHPTASRPVNMTKTMSTAGGTSLVVDLGDLGAAGYKALVTIDEATNLVTITAAPGAAGAPYTMFTSGLPTTNPGYTAGWAGSSAQYNRYDPATKTFYLRYGYMGGNGWRVAEEQLTKK